MISFDITKLGNINFESGLKQALIQTGPKEVLIYGPMPSNIFKPYQNTITFYIIIGVVTHLVRR